jgi:hypothetical protein
MPNFFVLGATRSGTASLTHYLGQHPSIYFTAPRDPAFFLRREFYDLGVEYYQRTFCHHAGETTHFGEATSAYFAHPHTVGPRLRAHFGDAPLKFVVLLREPVARAWSHYLARVHHGCEKRDFATALAEERVADESSEARYFAEGCYMKLMQSWQNYYPAESFLFLLSEDLAANPLAQVQRVFAWLGVDATVAVNVSERLNRARYSTNLRMVDFLNRPPGWLSRIGRQIWPEAWQRRRIRHHLRESLQSNYGTLPPLDPAVAAELRQRYHAEILALSKQLGRYLSHWMDDEVFGNETANKPLASLVL